MPSNDQSTTSTTGKWLSVVGIGEDGVTGLGDQAKSLISKAETVFGGRRHLELASSLINGEPKPWPIPFDTAMTAVRERRGAPVCVLASGDPFMHGVGATLAKHIPPQEMRVVPNTSAFSLAVSRLGWSLPDVETISLHGRATAHIRPYLHHGQRILALTSDAAGPGELAKYLTTLGFGQSSVWVLEALGGGAERISQCRAKDFNLQSVNPLNLVAIDVDGCATPATVPLTPGLGDDQFDHDGQITKRETRALTLAALAPHRGQLLWDIGAGSGSIAIEWMLRHPSLRAIAIEENQERAQRISSNASTLGVPELKVVAGRAPKAIAGLDRPDAIFIGGGGSDPGVMDSAIANLRPGGRLVANAVTLQMESVLAEQYARLGGSLVRLALSRAAPVGTMTGWRPAMPVTQWSWTKS